MKLRTLVMTAAVLCLAQTAFAQPTLQLDPAVPAALTGVSGGPRDGTTVGDMGVTVYCNGWVADEATPNHVITVTAPMAAAWISVVSDGGDPTLIVMGPVGELFCNDDYSGLNSALMLDLNPGAYRVWVGEYSPGTNVPYTLNVSTVAPATDYADVPPGWDEPMMDWPELVVPPTATPSPSPMAFGAANAGQVLTIMGMSGGAVDASTRDPSCYGNLPAVPQLVINVTDNVEMLSIGVHSTSDPTLFIEGPTGIQCLDDAYGLNPAISTPAPAGTYSVYVGTFSAGASEPVTIMVTAGTLEDAGAVTVVGADIIEPPTSVPTP